jgi:hypothetical protein
VLDAAWRKARAIKAGAAAKQAFREARETRGERYATKGIAYAAGYRIGYRQALKLRQKCHA